MPVYEYVCAHLTCPETGKIKESFLRSFNSPDPECPKCHFKLDRQVTSRVSVIWARPLSAYDSKDGQKGGDHIAYRLNSSRSGNPEPVLIDSIQKQREFCREEKLNNPADMNPNARPNDDGMSISTVGMPGAWASLPAGHPLQNKSKVEDNWV